jgi:hypothetical protein
MDKVVTGRDLILPRLNERSICQSLRREENEMPGLPVDGEANWGRKLNEFLLVAHGANGQLRNVAEVISVKDFGAIGDGVADDTAAVQAAATAAKAQAAGNPPETGKNIQNGNEMSAN